VIISPHISISVARARSVVGFRVWSLGKLTKNLTQ